MTTYSEINFLTTLIASSEKSNDPNIISQKLKELVDINVSIGQIKDILDNNNKPNKKSLYSLQMSDIF
jgi:hypothetical protein